MNFARFTTHLLLAATALCSQPAMAEAPPLEAYGALPTLEDATISQSGNHMALVMNVAGQRQVTVFDAALKPVRTMSFGAAKMRNFDWIGDDALLAVYSLTETLPFGFAGDKMEFYKALIIPNDDDAEPMSIFADRRDIMDAVFGNHGLRRVGNRWVGYFEGVQFKFKQSDGWQFDHGRAALFAVDMATNKPTLVAQPASESMVRDWLVDANGKIAATLDFNRNLGGWTITNSSGNVIARGSNPNGRIGLLALGADGTSLIYSQASATADDATWNELPLAGGEPKEILAGIDVERYFTDPLTGRMIGYVRGGTRPVPVFFDPAQQQAMQAIYASLGGQHLRILALAGNYERAIIRTSGTGNSGSWYLVDMKTGQPTRLGSERSRIPADQVGPVRVYSYAAADGTKMDGVLTIPPGREAKNLPVVMLPHGGPASHDEAEFDWWAQAFASRGYAVFQPNFRGSTNRDAAFEAAGNGEWGRKMQTDISDGLAALAEDGIVDPKRACIMGASYGGYAALAGVTIQHGIYKCAVAVAPVSDLGLLYQQEYQAVDAGGVARKLGEQQLGPRELFDEYSPRDQAATADAPILLIHGRDDTVVPFNHSEKMAAALKGVGKPYKLVELAAEDHWLSRPETRLQMLREAVDFVQQHNPAD